MSGRYWKLAVAIAGAVIMALYQATTGDDRLDLAEKIMVVSAGVGAFLVWLTANGPVGTAWRYAKAIAYGVTAVLATLLLVVADQKIVAHEWWELAIAFGTGAGVLVISGAPTHAPTAVAPYDSSHPDF
jgi:hypothetical protein